MPTGPGYGRSLAATFLGALVAALIMVGLTWVWAEVVLDVSFTSIDGRAEHLGTWDRILLYGGGLVSVFLGYVVYALCVRWLFERFQGIAPSLWDTFAALVAAGLLGAIVGHFLPFVGLLIVVFVAPAFVSGMITDVRPTPAGGGGAPRDYDPRTSRRIDPRDGLR